MPFFGTPAKSQTSLAAIWRKRPAPILPIAIERLAYGRHRLRVWPPLQVEKTNDVEADILRITGQCNQMLEKMIRVAPEQYFWLHNRWK
jgi:KDO2-lipid IV(A) lauroyltransferase